MGKKAGGKNRVSVDKSKSNNVSNSNLHTEPHVKLIPQKRNELNQLVDKLLRVSSNVAVGAHVTKEWEVYQEIQKVLKKIEQLESGLNVPLPERRDCVDAFAQWAKDNGVVMDGLNIVEYSGLDFGLKTERDIPEGDLMIAVPRKIMLSQDTATQSVLGELIKEDPVLKCMPNVTLALLLLVQRHTPDSFWKPYINMLPRTYNTVLYFKQQDLQELQKSPALETTLRLCRSIARQYAYFNRVFQNASDPASKLLKNVFTYEQYRWAVSTVMTRQNVVPGSEPKTAPEHSAESFALIPVWDLCNHCKDAKPSTDYSEERQRCESRAWRHFSAGEQVLILYGTRPNSDLFVHNGFVVPDWRYDALSLRLGVARADPVAAPRNALLKGVALPSAASDWPLPRLSPDASQPSQRGRGLGFGGRLAAFLRILNMDEASLEKFSTTENVGTLFEPECPSLDPAVEERAKNYLATRAKLLLATYPTTAEDDETLLGQQPSKLSPCARLAVQLRLEEKRLLKLATTLL